MRSLLACAAWACLAVERAPASAQTSAPLLVQGSAPTAVPEASPVSAQATTPVSAPATSSASAPDVARWIDSARAAAWTLPADVDYARDPLCRVGAVDVGQRDFTRWLALVRGATLVEARLLQFAALHAAREARDWLGDPKATAALAPTRLSAAQYSAVLDAWCRAKGLERAAGANALATALRLPREAALEARRAAIEAVIDFCAGRGASATPPPSTRTLFVEAGRWQEAAPLFALLEKWRAQPDSAEGAAALAAASEPLAVYLVTLRRSVKPRTTCTFLDHDLPGLAVAAWAPLAGQYGDQVPLTAPWTSAAVQYVDAAPIAAAVLAGLAPAELEAELRALAAVLVLRRECAERAGRSDDAAAWSESVSFELASQRAILGDEAIALLYDGFPHPAVWRAWRQSRSALASVAWPTGIPTGLVQAYADAAPWSSASAGRALASRVFDEASVAADAARSWRESGVVPSTGRNFREARYARLVHASSVVWRALASLEPGAVSEPLAFGSAWVVARRAATDTANARPSAWSSPEEPALVLEELELLARLREALQPVQAR
jgi:hypothetical protein